MAYSPFSSSSAFNVPLIKHDVFVSFRGIDIRTSFLSHLTKDLHRNQIDFFVDDEKLHPGDEISPTLLRAIEQSYISLVIFSKHYASSRWCMEELVKIIECMEQYKRIVIPVFYNVDPSHVRHQKGILAEAFDVHKERYEEEIMQSWKSVLKKTANLSGIHYPSKYR
ncbi:TMV resistance protein N [Arachis hypogaea]|nr:TMV resistance protein N [Arachis hypogaea]